VPGCTVLSEIPEKARHWPNLRDGSARSQAHKCGNQAVRRIMEEREGFESALKRKLNYMQGHGWQFLACKSRVRT
jgi:hypothetical protein